MALVKCKECGHQISKSATQCPSCGAKIRRTTLFTKIVAGFFGLVVISMVAGQLGRETPPATSSGSAAPAVRPTSAATLPLTPEQQAEAQKRRELEAEANRRREAIALGLYWRYDEDSEKMGRGVVKHAYVRSLNEFQFDFPYRDRQRATLMLRKHPKHGRDVILTIERGQFLCGIDDCTVAVKFDDGPARTYPAAEPSDHSSTALFIRGHDRFVAAAKKAKRAYVEAQFFQQGTRVFEFDVSDLKW